MLAFRNTTMKTDHKTTGESAINGCACFLASGLLFLTLCAIASPFLRWWCNLPAEQPFLATATMTLYGWALLLSLAGIAIPVGAILPPDKEDLGSTSTRKAGNLQSERQASRAGGAINPRTTRP